MRDVYDFAKYFIKNGTDSHPNTYDGNMKLQKMLTFANAISIAEYGEPLFNDKILAFTNGCVVEKIRLRYKSEYDTFKRESDLFQPDFSEKEYNVLNLTTGIFGSETAKTLSQINHEFKFWNESYKNGIDSHGFHSKEKSVVQMEKYPDDIAAIKKIIAVFKTNMRNSKHRELINGITFYYDGFELDENMIQELADFAMSDEAEDTSYTVCIDDGELVIY